MPYPTSSQSGDDGILEPIAICGMACRLPGGVDSASSFWDMLVEKKSGQTPRVPESRFNIDAYYHSNLERPGSFNVLGGYFLDGRPEDFDPGAFNMTPVEAQWLDPQQRKILEVAYECLENAGLTLESVAGSNTGVFIGSFTSDYQQMSIRDPDFRHNYAATGVDPGIISNRIGNTFNLKGPSFTINTACSSSIYALHNACNALRARDCDAAIVGGVNLIITVDQHMNTAKLGILSPTSTCHTFDASADGYGRGEGVGGLYVKRLRDAIRDGDPVRGVIRGSAVNTNGKVEGMGITHPSVKGQEKVVRMAYEKAGLDQKATAYAELHGTGTPVGDPIEVRAVANAMNDTRSSDKPLFLGAVKPNIGHSEAASGIFAVMKAALMTETGIIPGIAHFQSLNPAIHEKELNVKIHSDTGPWPKEFDVRRASVSSFGYGGTNGHVIVESVDSLYPWYQHAHRKGEAPYDRSSSRPHLLCFSAHDKITASRNVAAIGKVAGDYYMPDLAYTLNHNRTKWGHRAFSIAREGQAPAAIDLAAVQYGVALPTAPEIGFVFTGQGAQWAGMGRAACKTFPCFLQTVQSLDDVLARLEPRPSFKLVDLLQGDNETISLTLNEAQVAQPICTAVQIALVDLFADWGLSPAVTVGHSSGEIAAAYAAGLIAAPEAMIAAYLRGRAVHENASHGSMLAVGLGADDVHKYLVAYAPDQLCIACENSPGSVTLSGLPRYIDEAKEKLVQDGVFARELKTGRAYHSPHMASVGAAYELLLDDALTILDEDDFDWRRPRTAMVSSVSGEILDYGEMDAVPSSYWSENLRSRVLFDTAVRRIGTDPEFQEVKCLIEIGPHSALAGPIKQINLANKAEHIRYIPSFVRSKDDADQLLSVAGHLYVAGYPVDLEAVNAIPDSKMDSAFRKPRSHQLLVDLPPYQWNYERRHWAEPRGSAEQRSLEEPRHDLLGRRITGLSTHSRVWRNILRHRDIPWLKDHALGGAAIFPAAGHLSLAVEALRQVSETENLAFGQVLLRDVDISTALVIPETDAGVEIVLRLDLLPQQQAASGESPASWYSFSVESLSEDDKWLSHCRGRISAGAEDRDAGARSHPVDSSKLTQRVHGRRWYEAFNRVGFNYGPAFQPLGQIGTDRRCHEAEAELVVQTQSGVVQDESRYMIHPATIDGCFQLIIISIHQGRHKEMPWGVVPIHLEEVSLRFPSDGDEGVEGSAVAWTDGFEGRYFDTHTQLRGRSGKVLVDVKGLRCVSYEAAIPADASTNAADPAPFSTVSWKPDVLRLKNAPHGGIWSQDSSEGQVVTSLVEMIHHRKPLESVLLCGQPGSDLVDLVTAALPRTTAVTVVLANELPADSDWTDAVGGPHDLAFVDESVAKDVATVHGWVKNEGWLVSSRPGEASGAMVNGLTAGAALDPVVEVTAVDAAKGSRLVQLIAPHQVESADTTDSQKLSVAVVNGTLKEGEGDELFTHLSSMSNVTQTTTLAEYLPSTTTANPAVLVNDRDGTLLSTLDDSSFEALKTLVAGGPVVWLTRGVREGACTHGGMAQGFLRVIRSEQASARIILLDADLGERPERVAEAILRAFRDLSAKDAGQDTEFWLHNGVEHISRSLATKQLNAEWAPTSSSALDSAETLPLPDGVRLTSGLVDGQLTFTRDQQDVPSSIESDEIEIQVVASELQTTSNTPVAVAGRVLRRGSSASEKCAVGDAVIAWTTESLATIVRTTRYAHYNFRADEDLPAFLAAASVVSKAVNMCMTTANVSTGDRVLFLPGPEIMTRTLVKLAKAMGWNLALLASSPEEQLGYASQFGVDRDDVLISSGSRGIELPAGKQDQRWVVIGHAFTPLSQEVWRQLPSRAMFILNEAPLESAPDPLPFTRGAAFVPVSTKVLHGAAASEALRRAAELVEEFPELAEGVSSAHDISELSEPNDILRDVQRSSQIGIVQYRYNESQVKVTREPPRLTLSSEASYLLIGCLGGLGRSLATLMMERGARNFVFVSRSGADKPEAAQVVQLLTDAGASVRVFRADAASEADMARIVQEVNAEGPIRGVVHAAMVLRDGVFEKMDRASFQAAIDPKVLGAISLSKALEGTELDFFVMTSSISATLGNPGQSNYSAANSFLDALAWQRRLSGRAGVSLVLPMVLDVGVVAENASIETSLLRKGLYGIDEEEMLRGFEVAMSRPASRITSLEEVGDSQIILGLEPSELSRAVHSSNTVDAYWYQDARFSHLVAEVERMGQASSSTAPKSAGLLNLLQTTTPEEALGVIAHYIAQRVSSILLIPVEDFDLDGPSIASYGLDSMIGAELRNWLYKEAGVELSFQELLSPSLSFKKLAIVIAKHLDIISEEV